MVLFWMVSRFKSLHGSKTKICVPQEKGGLPDHVHLNCFGGPGNHFFPLYPCQLLQVILTWMPLFSWASTPWFSPSGRSDVRLEAAASPASLSAKDWENTTQFFFVTW